MEGKFNTGNKEMKDYSSLFFQENLRLSENLSMKKNPDKVWPKEAGVS